MMWMLDLLKLSQRLTLLSSLFWILFSSCCSDCLFFLLPYILYHWFDSWLHPLYCCFLVNCFLFHFWLDLFYDVEVLTKFLEHPYNQRFELCIWVCLSPFCLVSFLEFWSVLWFGPCFFVSSFWQPPCVCFYVLGRAAMLPCLSSMAYCSRCL